MKINKRGFTLIELLAVIVILGLVLMVGTYFTFVSIKDSKEKAFEVSKKGLFDSAITYATEFLEEEDWVEGNPTEYTCVNAWWLVNKGMQKKESFTDNESEEEYKFKKSDIIVLYRDTKTKVVTNAELPPSAPENCSNTLKARIISDNPSTYNSIKVTGICEIKNVVPENIEYKFCIGKRCSDYGKSNTYTFAGLSNDKDYKISLYCDAGDYGTASANTEISTQPLEDPIIDCSNSASTNNVDVDFKNENFFETLTKEVQVDKSGVKNNNNDIGINASQYYDKIEHFDISNIDASSVTFTASISDEKNSYNKKTATQTCYKKNEPVNINAPLFTSTDKKISGSWHLNNFGLTISSNNSEPVYYLYGTSENNITTEYSSQINVTNNATFYAKACSKSNPTNCSAVTTYVAKIDRNPPEITYTVKHVLSDAEKEIISVNEQELSHDLKRQSELSKTYYSYNESEDENIAWLGYSIKIYYSISDQESGLKSNAIYGISKEGYSYIASLSKNNKTLTLTNNGKSTNFNHEIKEEDGYRQIYLKVCDVAGNCTEKNLYFKIDKKIPTITRTDNGTGNNSFSCTSGLSGINRFILKGSSEEKVYEYDINGMASTATASYWISDSKAGSIYLTCSSQTHNFITVIPDEYEGPPEEDKWGYTGYRPSVLSRIITNGTYSFTTKNAGGTCYKWGCVRYGVSGYKAVYTTTPYSPYSQNCGLSYSYDCGTSSCPEGFSENPVTKGCYSFATYVIDE